MQMYMCNVCGKLHSLFNDAALCHPDVVTKEVEDLPARAAEHRNEAESAGIRAPYEWHCSACGDWHSSKYFTCPQAAHS